ncbi:hypothetical protein DPMN_151018 [Dreissena polymorpha]|uniref:Uncharacterized protein n=1 Tax=Dreissena polymorpha TaxID=45954 RepID=A0A9D4J6W2_DREPO|nr:hypothetical protein DPMN_151018 [Dreissena polymorpha]
MATTDRFSVEGRPLKAIAETMPSGRVRWLGPPCSTGRPWSSAEANGGSRSKQLGNHASHAR